MAFKFENLEVWKLSLEYVDKIYEVISLWPDREKHNLRFQMIRSITSVSLNIAESSTSQSDAEFSRKEETKMRCGLRTVDRRLRTFRSC